MPKSGAKLIDARELLTFEEIFQVTKKAVELGVTKVRLTGGEPLVRKNIITLIKMLADINGINDFAMTTNGTLLTNLAKPLKDAGLHRLNISIDTMNPQKYSTITRHGHLNDVIKGIEAAQIAGFKKIKINTVIDKSTDEADARSVATFAKKMGFEIRYIRKMDLAKGKFWKIKGGKGGNCNSCNRLRLSSNGFIRPCLFSDLSYNVRDLGANNAISMAVQNKPEKGHLSHTTTFYGLGG